MYVKITHSGSWRYVQLVESFRNEEGKVKQHTIATLGRLDQIDGNLEAVISGLLRVTGRSDVRPQPGISFESSRALGDIWALQELWNTLGFSSLARTFRNTRHSIDVEALIRLMVFNRLCDPESKLGVLRWLDTVAFPGLNASQVSHDRLLRAMDAHSDDRDRSYRRIVTDFLRVSVVFRFYPCRSRSRSIWAMSQAYPQANASAPHTLAGGRLWVSR